MKLFLGIACLIFCTIMGVVLSKKYTYRRNFYCDFLDFNKKLKNEISFSHSSILTIIKNYKEKEGLFFPKICGYFNNNEKIELEKNYFTEQESEYFSKYLSNLGVFDKSTQINYLISVENELESKLATAKNEEEKYKKLYVKLGFLIGLILLVMLL